MRAKSGILVIMLVLAFVPFTVFPGPDASSSQAVVASAKSQIPLISCEELKEKIARKQSLTIIDVRASSSYAAGDEKIKGAIHLKLRRLKYRLGFAPLKDVPREQEVITYCSCPGEESSLAAAQILLGAGFKNVRALKGGWDEWRKVSGPVEVRQKPL